MAEIIKMPIKEIKYNLNKQRNKYIVLVDWKTCRVEIPTFPKIDIQS